MVNAESVRNRITSKIFDPQIASTVVRTGFTSQVLDKWGDATITYATNENILGVPYSMLSKKQSYEIFADIVKGDVVMAFKYSQELNVKDKITFASKTYSIKQIEDFPLGNLYLVKIVWLSEAL